MIKFIVAAVWISLATTGALLYAFQSSQPVEEAPAEANAFQGLDYVKSGVISVPLLEGGRVKGYFLSRLVFSAHGVRMSQLKLPVDALLSDDVYTYLYANPTIDFSQRETIDVDAFRNGIKDSINARLGEELVQEVLIEQMDYLAKNEIQATTLRQPGTPPAPAEPQL